MLGQDGGVARATDRLPLRAAMPLRSPSSWLTISQSLRHTLRTLSSSLHPFTHSIDTGHLPTANGRVSFKMLQNSEIEWIFSSYYFLSDKVYALVIKIDSFQLCSFQMF